MQVIMGKYVMIMGTILENGKGISIAILHAFIKSYNGNHMGTITWNNGNTNVALKLWINR